MRRIVVKTGVAIAALMLASCAGLYWYLRQSLPVFDGDLRLAGITRPVEIIRDADAIPHIFASTKPDALFGLGYVHAQDRLWQMELQRRIGHGRLSEVFGQTTVPQDRFLRTVGFGRAARAAWERMPVAAKTQVDAYVAGVNAFITTHHGRELPPEFTVFRFEPEPWTGADVMVWGKMLAWDLSANYALELLRDDLVRTVGMERMQQLWPPYPADGLTILSKFATVAATAPPSAHPGRGSGPSVANLSAAALTTALSGGIPAVRDFLLGGATTEGLGSNNWVVDGSLSASGRPLLANDPHLSTQIPSTWYLAHLSAGDFDVIGATLPGTPAVTLGRNRFIAWGVTNALVDVEDLYRERLDGTGRLVEFRGANEPLTIVPETIVVKNAPSIRVDVRISRHGPLVTDAINANNAEAPSSGQAPPAPLEPMAFRWTALDPDDTTINAVLELNEARDWDGFTRALRQWVVPSQNFVYADAAGHIGYYTPGRIPIRAAGDGSLPVEGWTGEHEWIGWIPFEDLPHVVDPPEHFLVTANQRQVPSTYPFKLGVDWQEPLRALRITELLRAKDRFTPDDFARIQSDTVSVQARTLLPALLSLVRPESPADRQAVSMLRDWNLDARGDSAAAAIFAAWLQHVVPAIAADEVGPTLFRNYEGRSTPVTRFIERTLESDDARWCDDVTTTGRETCGETVTRALRSALDDLTRRLGGDPATWRWDGVHRAVFPHQGLGTVPLLQRLVNRSAPNSGDWSSINVGTPSVSQPYDQRSVPGYRAIFDLSPAGDSRFIIDVGQSGHVLSTHYDDFLEDWRAVRHRKMRMERVDIERGALGHLRLSPR